MSFPHRTWIFTLAAAGCSVLFAQNSNDALRKGFLDPPDSAKPRVWWHWMNGNITQEGIKADLEWMKRVGIGGFQNFDAAISTPQIVDKRLVFMTPEWKAAFKFTAQQADRLGLEMAIAASPGWSESGGPWVQPSQAMKKTVWTETRIEGGKPFHGVLPAPPHITGPFQNMPFVGRNISSSPANIQAPPPNYYADAAVIGFRLPDNDVPVASLNPKVTSSGGQFDLASLTDGDYAKATALPMAPVGEIAWIQFEFAAPQTVRGITLATATGGRGFGRTMGPAQEVQASDDGVAFRAIGQIPPGGVSRTAAFPAVTARFFRVAFKTPAPPTEFIMPGTRPTAGPTSYQITECVLHTGARVHRFEEKAAFSTAQELYSSATPAVPLANVIAKSTVVDLTSKMAADGTLDWTPPAGNWMVLRLGYSLLGITNHPASPEATGLEVDKLSRKYVRAYVENYLDQYKATVGDLMGKKGLQYFIIDSWEAGTQNWTDDMIAEFTKRRGYDPRPYLPALAGRVVESSAASDRFLFDFRKTIGELTAEYHYNEIGDALHARGMGRYSESHEVGRAFIGDGMDVKAKADVPMSAMWTPSPGQGSDRYDADIRESASVAHIYGQNVAAAESLTARSGAWSFSPETLKTTADREMAMGLNRFVIHTSVHQPVNDKVPGLGLGPFGQWFTRHETWAEQAKLWISYLTRSSYMLQQGQFVADVAYYYGEDSNVTALFSGKTPEVPGTYNFDYISTDALLNRLSAKDGRIVTPTGVSYRVLYLDANAQRITLAALKKVRDLVNAGAVVAGSKPIESPSQADNQAEFSAIANELWTSGKIKSGKPGEVLTALNAAPDIDYAKPQPDTELMFVHRTLQDGDAYWIDNRNNRLEKLDVSFRVAGKAPEFWYPETGRIAPAPYTIANGRTTVPLHLDPNEAVFVVFRAPAKGVAPKPAQLTETPLKTIDGAWEVSFQPNRGAPAKVTFDKLASYTDNADAGVKYFSGTATYSKSIDVPAGWLKGDLILDLGDVKNIAEVSVNGKALGTLWKTPFRIDLGKSLKAGSNQITVKVVNLWVNRLIGDQQPGAEKKYTYTTMPFYRADSPLLPSGLIGPVQIVSVK